MGIAKKLKSLQISDIFLMLSIICVGGFHEYISCILAVAMSVYLLVKVKRQKQFVFYFNFLSISVISICLFYGLTCLWAVDKGMAFIGLFKFLPILLYLFILWQENAFLERLFAVLPFFAAVVVLLTSVLSFVPIFKPFFTVADRLAGTFQYPNSFALLLLVCELILLSKKKLSALDFVLLAVLLGGILYTGSRTVFVLLLVSNFIMLFISGNKKLRLVVMIIAAALVVVLGVTLLVSGKTGVIYRFLRISFTESTFIGRFLYFFDAIPIILKHPFGLGYMGYFYIQQSLQTGMYTVAYIHNDFLQLLLDIGWVPTAVFIVSLLKFFKLKNTDKTIKLIVLTILLHSCFDFNFQFISMFCLLIYLVNTNDGKKYVLKKNRNAYNFGFAAAMFAAFYMAIPLMFGHFGVYSVSDALYPFNTRVNLSQLEKTADLEDANSLADRIISQNTAYYATYTIKAKYAYSKGDFGGLIKYKKLVFEKNPFEYKEYEEYAAMLVNGISLYQKAGDTASVYYCYKELIELKDALAKNNERLSKLGSMITDQPTTELPKEILEFIENGEEALSYSAKDN